MTSDLSLQLARLDAVDLASTIERGDVSPREVLDSTLERLDAVNDQINAVIHDHRVEAHDQLEHLEQGPFRGVPMLMKDLWACEAGRPHHQGVAALKEHGALADRDSHLIARYRAAGFVSFGRTNTPEMGAAATTEPLAYGPTHNPWNLDHGPGGSSGGAAAAVAAGVLPAANASDGGGSIRIPAAMCGLVGLKPSRGRMSMGPHMDEWANSVQHVVCHTVPPPPPSHWPTAQPTTRGTSITAQGGHQAVPPLRSLLVSCRPPTQATEADRSEFPQRCAASSG